MQCLFPTQTLFLLSGKLDTISSSQGVTVMCCKRGGDTSASSHGEWLLTVSSVPDIINFTFLPITSLLKGVPGYGFLSHAINLYIRCKCHHPLMQA